MREPRHPAGRRRLHGRRDSVGMSPAEIRWRFTHAQIQLCFAREYAGSGASTTIFCPEPVHVNEAWYRHAAEETLGELREAVQRLDPTQLCEILSTDDGELREFVIAALGPG